MRAGRGSRASAWLLYVKTLRRCRRLNSNKAVKRSIVDAAVIRRAESVDNTSSVTLVQAGLIQRVFEQAELRVRHGGGC